MSIKLEVLNWKFSNFLENNNYKFSKNEVLNIVNKQDLEEAYHDAGQFYWSSANNWKHLKSIFSSNSLPLILPRGEVIDIDTEEDWEEAEIKFRLLKENQS